MRIMNRLDSDRERPAIVISKHDFNIVQIANKIFRVEADRLVS